MMGATLPTFHAPLALVALLSLGLLVWVWPRTRGGGE